jgi:hypothetical protein
MGVNQKQNGFFTSICLQFILLLEGTLLWEIALSFEKTISAKHFLFSVPDGN